MYNQEKLIKIIKNIQGDKSLNNYASDIEVDSSTLSRIMNYIRVTPPKPYILRKIADNSKGITTYVELLQVCGYLDDLDIEEIYTREKEKRSICENANINNYELINIRNSLIELKELIKMSKSTTDTQNQR